MIGWGSVILGVILAMYQGGRMNENPPLLDPINDPKWEEKANEWRATQDRRGWLLAGGVALAAFGGWHLARRVPTAKLQSKVVALNPFAGKTLSAIQAALGPPAITQHLEGGRSLLTWSSPGYTIALLFEEENCLGVSSEANV
jgi:hypothetical protein